MIHSLFSLSFSDSQREKRQGTTGAIIRDGVLAEKGREVEKQKQDKKKGEGQ